MAKCIALTFLFVLTFCQCFCQNYDDLFLMAVQLKEARLIALQNNAGKFGFKLAPESTEGNILLLNEDNLNNAISCIKNDTASVVTYMTRDLNNVNKMQLDLKKNCEISDTGKKGEEGFWCKNLGACVITSGYLKDIKFYYFLFESKRN